MIRKRRRRQREDEEGGELPVALSPDFEITPGLVPVGIPNVYQSPVEPVDPRDCERWPNSPYCGGIPISTDRADLGVDFAANPCEICVTITPVLGFVELAPYTICVRRNSPECIPRVPITEFPEVPAPDSYENPRRNCSEGIYKILVEEKFLETRIVNTNEIISAHIPQDAEYGDAVAIEQDWNNRVQAANLRAQMLVPGSRIAGIISEYDLPHEPQNNPYLPCRVVLDSANGEVVTINNYVSPGVYNGGKRIVYDVSSNFGSYTAAISQIKFYLNYAALDGILPQCQGSPINDRSVEPPPYPQEPCCMACCNGNNSETEDLVRLIAKRLGTNDYPIAVPQSLLADRGSGKKTIESLSQFLHWFILQVDSVTGQFPVELEIKDNDPTKEGDQREKITIPNLAEGIAEILGASVNANINTQTLINAGIRTLVEAGSAKIHALETRYISQAIADYLAFDATEVKTPVGMTFTAGKTQLDEILQESEQKLPLYTYSDDRDFKAEMTELLFAAAVIRAVHYRKVTGDPKEDLKQRFKDLIKFAESEISPPTSGDEDQPKPKTDFDNFIEQVETGFINTPGIDDATNPYGRPYSERPRIRELGNTADNTDVSI